MARPSDILKGVGRPIAYYPNLRKITGSTVATIFLCQFIYWEGKQADKENGWIYKPQNELEEETGLSRYEQETARRHLRERGLLYEEKKGLPCKLYYKIDYEKLDELWNEKMTDNPCNGGNGENQQTRMGESNIQGCGDSTNKHAETQQTSMQDSTKQDCSNTTSQKSSFNTDISTRKEADSYTENTTKISSQNTTNNNNTFSKIELNSIKNFYKEITDRKLKDHLIDEFCNITNNANHILEAIKRASLNNTTSGTPSAKYIISILKNLENEQDEKHKDDNKVEKLEAQGWN